MFLSLVALEWATHCHSPPTAPTKRESGLLPALCAATRLARSSFALHASNSPASNSPSRVLQKVDIMWCGKLLSRNWAQFLFPGSSNVMFFLNKFIYEVVIIGKPENIDCGLLRDRSFHFHTIAYPPCLCTCVKTNLAHLALTPWGYLYSCTFGRSKEKGGWKEI